MLSLSEKSWDGLWSELLSADFESSVQEQSLLPDPEDTLAIPFQNVEGGIESWAADNLQQRQDTSLYQQLTPDKTSLHVNESRDLGFICYGMVNPSNRPFLLKAEIFSLSL